MMKQILAIALVMALLVPLMGVKAQEGNTPCSEFESEELQAACLKGYELGYADAMDGVPNFFSPSVYPESETAKEICEEVRRNPNVEPFSLFEAYHNQQVVDEDPIVYDPWVIRYQIDTEEGPVCLVWITDGRLSHFLYAERSIIWANRSVFGDTLVDNSHWSWEENIQGSPTELYIGHDNEEITILTGNFYLFQEGDNE